MEKFVVFLLFWIWGVVCLITGGIIGLPAIGIGLELCSFAMGYLVVKQRRF